MRSLLQSVATSLPNMGRELSHRVAMSTCRLVSASCEIPHPAKRVSFREWGEMTSLVLCHNSCACLFVFQSKGGEDAHFMYKDVAVGVADGVGGWADRGVDRKFHRQLQHFCHIPHSSSEILSHCSMRVCHMPSFYSSRVCSGYDAACRGGVPCAASTPVRRGQSR
jgi:hypothetical protein